MKQEKRTFKNPRRVIQGYAELTVEADELVNFDLGNWDVEITFTKKVKPIPDGTLAKYESVHYMAYYIKRDGVWYYLDELGVFDQLGRKSQYQEDEWFLEHTKPMTTSDWE